MSKHEAFVCNRCKKVELDKLPKEWESNDKAGIDPGTWHYCKTCQKLTSDLEPFLEWIQCRVARIARESMSSSLVDVFSSVGMEVTLEDLFEQYRRNEPA